jgi:flagellar biosynthetic protein FliR
MFPLSESDMLAWTGHFVWALARIGGMLMVAPLFGAQYVPMRIRAMYALALTAALLPVLPMPPETLAPFSLEGVLALAQQVLIGVAAGFVLQLVFDAVVVGIQTVSMSMGLGFAVLVDSQSGIQVPTLSQLYLLLALLLFLAMNGHHAVIEMTALSFTTLPVGTGGLDTDVFWELATWGSTMFAGAVKIALPAATAVLIANISIGVISRAAPTLNLFAVGLPFTILAGFGVLMLTLPSLQAPVQALLTAAFSDLASWLGGEG